MTKFIQVSIQVLTVFIGTFLITFLPFLVAYFAFLNSFKNSSHASDRFWNECHHKMHLFFPQRHLIFNRSRSHVRVPVKHQNEELNGSERNEGFNGSGRQDERLARYLSIHSKALMMKSIVLNEFKIISFGIFCSIVLSLASSLLYLATGVPFHGTNALGLAPSVIFSAVSTLVFSHFQKSLTDSKSKVEDIIEESRRVSRMLRFRSE